MMESCGICFRLRRIEGDEWEYIAPELLPPWSGAQGQLLGRLRDDPPAAEAEAHYGFLHEGVLRHYLSKIGKHAKDAPVYWKYGCWFYEETTKSQALIEGQWEDAQCETGPGVIRFRAWGERTGRLIKPLVAEPQRLPLSQVPEVTWHGGQAVHGPSHRTVLNVAGKPKAGLSNLEIPNRPELPNKGQARIK